MKYTAELDTLDQLQGRAQSLKVIRQIYPDTTQFLSGVHGLLKNGDVMLSESGTEVPEWQWRHLFVNGTVMEKLDAMTLSLTEQGAKRA